MSIDRYKVLDLTGGMGAMSLAFEQMEFDIICAVEGESENAEIYKSQVMNKNLIETDLLNLDYNSFPYSDIVIADLSSRNYKKRIYDNNKRNEYISELILNTMPKMFLLKIPLNFLNNHNDNIYILSTELQRRYTLSYAVLKESDYSGLPTSSNQLYIVGICCLLASEPFEFPEPIQHYEQKVFVEAPFNVDDWYRNTTRNFGFMHRFEEGTYCTNRRNVLYKTKFLNYNAFSETYYIDAYGLRRLTHNEYAFLKGYKYYDFDKCTNKSVMYRKLANSPNVYVVRAIAERILLYLHELHHKNTEKEPVIKNPTVIKDKKTTGNRDIENIVFPKQKLLNIHIDKLKGLKSLDITIEKNLTAIMGVNGAGKSTILHALACMYSPYKSGTYYPFSFFFTPTPDSIWSDSKLSITYFDENKQEYFTRPYKKGKSWSPQRSRRPIRDVFYIGIDTGIPEIEKERQTSFIDYSTNEPDDKDSVNIIKYAANILNKDYQSLAYHKTRKKELLGIHSKSGIKYSSLSMGAGEQRLIKILKTVLTATQYSLILIDEIDLLLHVSAIKQLIIVLNEIVQKRHLQIIFTTHSLAMTSLTEYVDIRYLYQLKEKTIVYDTINPDIIYELSNNSEKPIEVYVEDLFAETLIKKVTGDMKIRGKVTVKRYGSVNNAFTLAAAFVLEDRDITNTLIVLDGDVCKSGDDKSKAIASVLSGTEKNHDKKIDKAKMCMTQFNLPANTTPEEFIHHMLIELDSDLEIVEYAKEINAVLDSHKWIDKIVDRLGENKTVALSKIIDLAATHPDWNNYVNPIYNWLNKKKEELKL